ncbi:MAG: serine protease [Planctomycetes bacterium]|nr:serine protease [Planctomycetota bacterium]
MAGFGRLNAAVLGGVLCVTTAICSGGALGASLDQTTAIADFLSTYEKSVAMIMTVRQDFDYVTPWKKLPMSRGVGTGFVIEGDRILTNAHNVANARYIEVVKQYEAKRYPAKVEFIGHDCDLALLSVNDASFFRDMVPLSFGGIPRVNSTVHTCGFPMGGRQLSITEGVVSRIEYGTYSHTQAHTHLLVQTDAAINPGNSGGPVLQDGKVVGVAFQGLQSADNIGYMIPTTVIQHFLTDVQSGGYDGFGTPGFSTFEGLHNPFYKAFLRIPSEISGVVVTNVVRGGTAEGVLQKGDVLTRIDDFDIDNDGMIRIYGLRVDFSEAIDIRQIGQTVEIGFYRNGEPRTADLKVALNAPLLAWARQYDIEPKYHLYAGLTFVTVSRNYLETWGRNWPVEIPFPLRYLFFHANDIIDDPNRKEFVVVSEILPDEVNAYVSGFKNQVVQTVNGMTINALEDLRLAFEKDIDGYWIVCFMNNDSPMIIDAQTARQRHAEILERYNVPAASN